MVGLNLFPFFEKVNLDVVLTKYNILLKSKNVFTQIRGYFHFLFCFKIFQSLFERLTWLLSAGKPAGSLKNEGGVRNG